MMSFGIVAVMIATMMSGPATQVSAAGQDYYKDTGHYLFGQFRDYWNGNGGVDRFGYPITKVLSSKSENGMMYATQYLQRAVVEEHPENAGTKFEVLGRRLAALQNTDRQKTDPNFQKIADPKDSKRAFFPDTGHTIGGTDAGNNAIRAYWNSAGNGDTQRSILVFGYPISEPFDEMNPPAPAGDGKMHRVQYFERYRLEYHPEISDPKYQVLLGLLGTSQADNDGIGVSDPNRAVEMAGVTEPACVQGAIGGICAGGGLTQSAANVHVGSGGDGYGFNLDGIGLDGPSKDTVLGKVQEAKFGWIRQQVRWSSVETSKGQFGNNYTAQLDSFVNAANAKGLNILLSPISSPAWTGSVQVDGSGGLPTNPQDFADFVGFLADRYKGKIAAYEMWNEENYARETGGTVNVAAYLPILKAGYTVLKAKDPNITVVFGGMTPTGVTGHPEIALDETQYLQQFYALNGGEGKKYYDVLGAHPGSNCNPPDNSYPENPATSNCGTDPDGGRRFTKDNSFYFKRVAQLHGVMDMNGEGGKKMWLTEFGWDSNPTVVPGYDYSPYISEDQQGQYITKAYDLGKSYSWMGVMFVWNLNFQQTVSGPTDEKWGWGVLRNDLSPRPAFTALKSYAK